MNLKEIEYIVTIADEQKLSRAGQNLFVTPSALTQHVSNMEQQIGLPLFYRSRSGWTPTEAGLVYLQSAREILQIRRETDRKLQDLADARKGSLTIGVTSEHGTSTFTHIYPDFHKRYPEVTINIYESNVRSQQQMLASGELDLGILTLSEQQQTEDIYIPLAKEELLFAIPDIHPACSTATHSDRSRYPELDPVHVRHEPFAMMYKQSTMYEVISRTFQEYDFHPDTLFYAQRSATALEMVSAGICCSVVPAFFAIGAHPTHFEHVAFFSFPSHPSLTINASYKKGSYLTDAAQYFIKLAREYWGRLPL